MSNKYNVKLLNIGDGSHFNSGLIRWSMLDGRWSISDPTNRNFHKYGTGSSLAFLPFPSFNSSL